MEDSLVKLELLVQPEDATASVQCTLSVTAAGMAVPPQQQGVGEADALATPWWRAHGPSAGNKKRRRIPKGKLSLRKGTRRRDEEAGECTRKRSRSRSVKDEDVTEWGDTMDSLYGCRACSYDKDGCEECGDDSLFDRPVYHWKPEQGRSQADIPAAPTFYPTLEEFRDPFAYVNKIRPHAEKFGICCIVPPDEFRPPFAIDTGANGIGAGDFMFHIRKQPTSQLCVRDPVPPATPDAAEQPAEDAAADMAVDALDDASDMAAITTAVDSPAADAPTTDAAVDSPHVGRSKYGGARARRAADEPCAVEAAREFGFVTLPDAMSFQQFAVVADWVKERHFRCPTPRATARSRPLKRFKCYNYRGPQPSVEQVEAEFWRVVETPDAELISLYGQDIDSGHHGSGFPLPPWRLRMLEERMQADGADSDAVRAAVQGVHHGGAQDKPGDAATAVDECNGSAAEGAAVPDGGAGAAAASQRPRSGRRREKETAEEQRYRYHRWNINNLPRSAGSVLRHVVGDELITGVMVPWLYIGSALSAFCWHIEDHGFYSINYMHMGQPKVWYGVPGHAAAALEEAMRDALPDLFEATPGLAYQLVTMLSPQQLRARGVPVHRVVHHEGSFVITFPNAYHAGFNTGFNCAEAVNFAPPDWIPWGSELADKYRRDAKPLTLSHDALFLTLVRAARKQHDAEQLRVAEAPKANGLGLRPRRTDLVSSEELDHDQHELEGVPEEAIRLATGELALRIAEERRRREAGLATCPPIRVERMQGSRGAVCPAREHLLDTEDVDCDVCKCDLYLSAVVAPGSKRATCPEHAAAHGDALAEAVLLERLPLEELDALVADAVALVPGAQAAIEEAQQRKAKLAAMCPEVIKLGPVKPVLEKEAAMAERAAKAAARSRASGRVPGKRPRGRPRTRAVHHAAEDDVATPPPPTPGAGDVVKQGSAGTGDTTLLESARGALVNSDAQDVGVKQEQGMEGQGEQAPKPAPAPLTAAKRTPSRRRARMTDMQSASPPAAKVQAVEGGGQVVLSHSGRPQRLNARRDVVWGNLAALANKGPATRYKPQGSRASKRAAAVPVAAPAAAVPVAAPAATAAADAAPPAPPVADVPMEQASPCSPPAAHEEPAVPLAAAPQPSPTAAAPGAGAAGSSLEAPAEASAEVPAAASAGVALPAGSAFPEASPMEELLWDQLLAPDAGSDMQAVEAVPVKHSSSEEEGGAVVPMGVALHEGLLA